MSARPTLNGAERATVWRLAIAQTVVWAGTFYLFPALLPHWRDALGWPLTTLTGAYSAALVVSALAAPAAGRLIDRGYGRALLLGALLSAGLLLLALAQTDRTTGFYAIWLLLGVAMAGALYEPCFAYLTLLYGDRARLAITRVTLVAGFAGSLAFPLAHALSRLYGWRFAALCFAAAVLLIAAPLVARCPPAPARVSAGGPAAAAPRPRRGPLFWLLAAAFAAIMLNHGMLMTHLLPLLYERGVAPALAVFAAATVGPMQVTGRLLMLYGGDRLSSTAYARLTFIALAAAATLLTVAGASAALIFAFVVLQGCGYGITSIIRPLVTAEFLGRDGFGATSGLMAVPFIGAMAAAPTLGSLLAGAGGYALLPPACLLVALLGLGGFTAAARLRARHG